MQDTQKSPDRVTRRHGLTGGMSIPRASVEPYRSRVGGEASTDRFHALIESVAEALDALLLDVADDGFLVAGVEELAEYLFHLADVTGRASRGGGDLAWLPDTAKSLRACLWGSFRI